MATSKSSSRRTGSAVAKGRRVQKQTDAKDQRKQQAKASGSASKQAAAKKQPAPTSPRPKPRPPLPGQHLRKPGEEAKLDPRPQFEAPDYRGSGKLEGMAAIITGGDSGIGRAVAVLFAREGADVAVVYLSEDEDARETKRYVEKEGRRCLLVRGDVRDPDFCEQAVQQTIDAFGRLDVLVNNAAFQEHADALEDITEEHLDLTMRTNIYGYFHMAKAALPHLHEGSAIINTGSETGLFGNAQLLDYSATKGAIHAFTMSLASNLVSRGIRVNAVAPGPVWTPLNPADKEAKRVAKFGQQNPLGRPAQPEELSPAYVFLAAPSCSSYVNGAILPVMGGSTG
jgi:NAD(P)-dependent dehydrogenase (short-subunit alcohol dehydrogenase family)